MGFLMMIVSALLGITLVIAGANLMRKNKTYILLVLLGLLSVAVAVYLAWPK